MISGFDGTTIKWNAVPYADMYQLDVNGKVTSTEDLSCTFYYNTNTILTIRIKTIADKSDDEHADSEWSDYSEFEYIASLDLGLIGTYDGLGQSVNMVKAQSYSDFITGASVLNKSKLAKMNDSDFSKSDVKISDSSANSSNSIYNLLSKTNMSYEVDSNTQKKYYGILGSLVLGYKTNRSFEYGDYNSKYFYNFNHNWINKEVSIINYNEKEKFENLLDESFLNVIENLNDNYESYVNFFNKYGTHIIGSARYGAKLDVYYSVVTNKKYIDTSTSIILESKISSSLGDIFSSSASVKTDISEALKVNLEDVQTSFYAKAIGGKAFGMSDFANFATNYESWRNSLDNIDNNVLIDYGGIVAIWDILPDKYSNIAEKMKSYFDKYYNENLTLITLDFRSENTTDFAGGDGSAENPFKIANSTHLRNIEKDMAANYKLISDIDLTNYSNWNPLGGMYKDNLFVGKLDGKKEDGEDNYKIINFNQTNKLYEKNNRGYYGLFGGIGVEGIVKNIDFSNVSINVKGKGGGSNNRLFIGAVAGYCSGTIDNIKILSGQIRYKCASPGETFAGGIVGCMSYGNITNCTNKSEVYVVRDAAKAGGICGYAIGGSIINCINNGKLTSWSSCFGGGSSIVGGIVGQSTKTTTPNIADCKSTGNMNTGGYSGTSWGYSEHSNQSIGYKGSSEYK